MTLDNLIEQLRETRRLYPELADKHVFSAYDYGDYNSTEAVVPVDVVAVTVVKKSGYSASGYAVPYIEGDLSDPKYVMDMAEFGGLDVMVVLTRDDNNYPRVDEIVKSEKLLADPVWRKEHGDIDCG